ncbi:hypothetical protein ACLB2K_061027 [Fragaria x ananassa]
MTISSNMKIMWSIILALLLFMLTSTLPTSGFSIPLIPIDSVILPKNHTPEERHHLLAEISRNQVPNQMSLSSGRKNNPAEEFMNDLPSSIQTPNEQLLISYYVTRIAIGSQLYTPYLAVTTAFAETWVQCDGCISCFPVVGGNFKYKQSTSFQYLLCRDPLCVPRLCDGGGLCKYNISYGAGKKSEGWESNDTFTSPSTNQTSIKWRVAFGCAYDNQNWSLGDNNQIAGIFGLGWGQRSILKQLAKETNLRFSYCLPSSTTPSKTHPLLSFGKDAKISGSVQTTDILLVQNWSVYNVNLLGISIAGKRLNIDPALFKVKKGTTGGGFIINTGTPYTHFVRGAYTILREEVVQYMMNQCGKRPTRKGVFDVCYEPLRNVTLPSMTYHFKGANLVLDSKAVFEDFNSTICMAILPVSDAGINELGAFQQTNHRFLFDLGKKSWFLNKPTLSFAPEICQ